MESKIELKLEKKLTSKKKENEKKINLDIPKTIPIKYFNYENKNKITLNSLKNGKRIFYNKTELTEYNENDPEFNQHFIEFRQLLFENLLLTEDLKDNSKNEKKTIESALFSTFVYEAEFIEPMIKTFKLPTIIIRHQENNHKYNRMEENGEYIKFIYPKIEYTLKWGCFHSKLILLKFPSFLRIIVPTANLTNCDWYFWGQIIWFQDFPLKDEKKTFNYEEEKENENFEIYLKNFLETFMPHTYEGKRFWTDLKINLNDYDYSNSAVDLIASANGRFESINKNIKNNKNFGIDRINFLMKTKYKSIEKNSNMIIQCSSIGKSTKKKFFDDLYSSFNLNNNPSIDILYPTIKYVNSFPLGNELSSCLFLDSVAFNMHKNKFKIIELKSEFNKLKTIFHSKFFITGTKDKNGNFNINKNSLLYFGSHNFSAAAWGNYEKKDDQISMSNYELGILFDLNKLNLYEKQNIFNSIILNVNSNYYEENQDEPFLQNFFK
jgi:tyrosyl-DNA phosphodiesterase-1